MQEYEFDEDSGKRQKTDLVNGGDSNKRLRDDSPLLDNITSPSKQISKRLCMYDEYAASCSSTDYSFKTSDLSGSKRKSVSTSKKFIYISYYFLMLLSCRYFNWKS